MDDDVQEVSFDEEIEVVDGSEEEGEAEQGEAAGEFAREKPNHSRKGQKKKHYSIGFKVSCLDSLRKNGNLSACSKSTGVSRSCLQDWKKQDQKIREQCLRG